MQDQHFRSAWGVIVCPIEPIYRRISFFCTAQCPLFLFRLGTPHPPFPSPKNAVFRTLSDLPKSRAWRFHLELIDFHNILNYPPTHTHPSTQTLLHDFPSLSLIKDPGACGEGRGCADVDASCRSSATSPARHAMASRRPV